MKVETLNYYIYPNRPVGVYMTEKKTQEIGESYAHMSPYSPSFYRNFYIIIIDIK